MPLVQVIRHLDGLEADSVRSDEAAGGALAMRHALAMGHRRIAVLTGPQNSSASSARRSGYLGTLHEAGIAPLLLIEVPLTRAAGYQITTEMLRGPDRTDAIVCGNDLIALGAMDAAMDAGLRVPQDVAIIGYDDMAFASARPVSLTTVHQPLQEMGATAIALLLQRIREPGRTAKTVILPHHLAIRRSCGNPEQGQPA
jgi:LacI family transcriptional regulator